MSREENKKTHQMRLSIEIISIKDHEFTAQAVFKYSSIPDLGIKHFQSSKPLQLFNAKVQTKVTDTFNSYAFQTQATQIQKKLSNKLTIQTWHQDKYKKDQRLGISNIQMKNLLNVPLRKAKEVYARVFDAYVPIDEVDQKQEPIKQIGVLRVVIYLEDMGPADALAKRGFDIKDMISNIDEIQMQHVPQNPQLPSKIHNQGQRQQMDRLQLNQLQYKVVWELQTWKKAEQAKTRIFLKQKQVQFWTNLADQQRKSDIQKQKQFKKRQANLNIIQGKLKAKINQLSKRQQKIIVYEQELQNKVNEVSKQLLNKDEEIERLKKRQKDEKTAIIKEKSNLELQISKLRAENAKLRVQLEENKKQDEKSPLNMIKNELNHKNLEINKLANELQECIKVKQQFKIHYEKMKNEVINLRKQLGEKDEAFRSLKYEYALLQNNYKHLQQKITELKQQQLISNNQQRNNNYEDFREDDQPRYSNQRQALIYKRNKLLQMGPYTKEDDLIKQYDRLIAAQDL